jgi:dolichol-phosphate mannosyltransferase
MLNTLAMVPTYNEKDNIRDLINDILSLDESIGVVVVDDDSPDGTSDIVESMRQNEPRIHLITRKDEKGRGTAGIKGLLYAVDQGVEYVVEMDADYSHHPKYIPDLIEAMKEFDVSLGSRAIEGGKETGRNFVRIGITQFAGWFIRMLMGVDVKDCTSGFRCFKAEVLKSIGLEKMVSVGPSIVEEILYACHLGGFKIKEIPIIFEDRTRGESTKTLGQYIETMARIAQFRVTMRKPKKR